MLGWGWTQVSGQDRRSEKVTGQDNGPTGKMFMSSTSVHGRLGGRWVKEKRGGPLRNLGILQEVSLSYAPGDENTTVPERILGQCPNKDLLVVPASSLQEPPKAVILNLLTATAL